MIKSNGLYILTIDKHELYNSELDHNSHVKSLKRKRSEEHTSELQSPA